MKNVFAMTISCIPLFGVLTLQDSLSPSRKFLLQDLRDLRARAKLASTNITYIILMF